MNHLKSLFCLLLLWPLAGLANAQESNHHYRYFTVTVKNLNRSEFEQFTASRAGDSTYQIHSFCSTNASVLVKIDASATPKRIEDIKTKLQELFVDRFSPSRVQGVETISYTDHLNYCK